MRKGEKNTFQTNHDSRKNFTLAKILVRHPTVGNLDATGGGFIFYPEIKSGIAVFGFDFKVFPKSIEKTYHRIPFHSVSSLYGSLAAVKLIDV